MAFDACHSQLAANGDFIMNVFFMLDVLTNFFTCYKDEETGVLIESPKLIAKNYASGWLFMDLLASVPWDWFDGAQASNLQMVKTVRLLRVSRVLRTLKVARVFKFQNFKHIQEKFSLVIEASPMLIFLVGTMRVVGLLFAMTHWSACVWYVIGMSDDKGPTWVKAHMPDEADEFQRYIYSVYFTLTTMTTVGYGDIVASNFSEVCFVLVLLLQASIVFASLMGVLTDLISTLNTSAKIEAERKRILSQYMSWREVPRSLFLRVREHLLFRWAACDGNDAFEQEIKSQLSPVLKKELCYHIYGRVLRSAPFLSWMHEAALKDLANVVETIYMSKGDYIFRLGQVNEQVYLMLQGTVRLSLNESLFEDPLQDTKEEASLLKSAALSRFLNVARQVRVARRTGKVFASSVLKHAATSLRKLEAQESWAARFIQNHWRKKKKLEGNHHFPPADGELASTTLSAPSYLGEACLWAPYEEWTTNPPKFKYSARCESRVELVYISRDMIGEVIERYKPWQLDRLQYFQKCVMTEMKECGVRVKHHRNGMRNHFSTKEWDTTDLHVPEDDHAIGVSQCRVLLRVAASSPPRGVTADHHHALSARPPRHWQQEERAAAPNPPSFRSTANPLAQPLLR